MTFLIVVLIKISCDILVVRVPYILGKKGTLVRSFCCPPVCLSVKTHYRKNAWRYQVEIQTIYSDLRPHNFLKKEMYFYIYLHRDMAVNIAKNVYFDTINGIKINKILSVDIELKKLAACIYG